MAKKIKILRIINRFNLGGPTYNVTFLSAFISDKFETKLVGGMHEDGEGDAKFIPEKYGVPTELISGLTREINFKKDRQAYKEIKSLIKEYKPDIVHTHASKAGAIGRLAAARLKVPVIVHTFHGHVFHSYFGSFKTSIYKIIERYLAKKTTAIIAISKKQKSELVNEFKIASDSKVKVVNLGFDLDKFQTNQIQKRTDFVKTYQIDEDSISIGIIGRLTAIKNHGLFFESLKLALEQTSKKVHIFIIGDGELKEVLVAESKDKLSNFNHCKVSFTSWIKDVSIPLSRLDIICLTSLNEGTPVSLIEAQASGVPVVSTQVGGVEDIVLNHKTGIIVNSFNPKDFADALLLLIDDDSKRKMMSKNGWEFVCEKFNYKTLCFNIEQLYLNLLKYNHDKT